MSDSQTRIGNIKDAIDNREVHRATTSLMDFLKDYLEESALLPESVLLRKKYNNLRQLGSSEINEKDASGILDEAHKILRTACAISHLEKDRQLLSQYPVLPLITAKEIEKKYPGGKFRLGPVSTVLRAGEITGIVGENGNGKTTLLRILATQLGFDGGNLTWHFDGEEITENYLIKNKIAYIPQKLDRWNGTLRENLHFAAANHGITGTENENAVEFVIHRMGLSRFADLGWSELSSGYKLRFELARMLVWSPRVLILDEPLANLDINAQQSMLNDFRNIAGSLKNPVSIILSSQQLFEVEHIADSLIFLRNGSCVYSGPSAEFMKERNSNVFEISGDFSAAQLSLVLTGKIVSVSENGSSITVNTTLNFSSSEILTALINAGFSIKYFRDISTSTKQLFKL